MVSIVPEASRGVAGRVKFRKGRESLAGPTISVGVVDARQMNSGRPHIGRVELEIAEIMIDPSGPASHVAVGEIFRDPGDVEQLHISGRESVKIILEAPVIEHRIGGNILGTASCEDRLSLRVVSSGKIEPNEGVLKGNRLARLNSRTSRFRVTTPT